MTKMLPCLTVRLQGIPQNIAPEPKESGLRLSTRFNGIIRSVIPLPSMPFHAEPSDALMNAANSDCPGPSLDDEDDEDEDGEILTGYWTLVKPSLQIQTICFAQLPIVIRSSTFLLVTSVYTRYFLNVMAAGLLKRSDVIQKCGGFGHDRQRHMSRVSICPPSVGPACMDFNP